MQYSTHGTKQIVPSPLDPVKIGQNEIADFVFLDISLIALSGSPIGADLPCESLLFTTVKKEQSHERLFPN